MTLVLAPVLALVLAHLLTPVLASVLALVLALVLAPVLGPHGALLASQSLLTISQRLFALLHGLPALTPLHHELRIHGGALEPGALHGATRSSHSHGLDLVIGQHARLVPDHELLGGLVRLPAARLGLQLVDQPDHTTHGLLRHGVLPRTQALVGASGLPTDSPGQALLACPEERGRSSGTCGGQGRGRDERRSQQAEDTVLLLFILIQIVEVHVEVDVTGHLGRDGVQGTVHPSRRTVRTADAGSGHHGGPGTAVAAAGLHRTTLPGR